MPFNLLADKLSQSRNALRNRWTRALVSLCVFGLPLGAGLGMGFALGYQHSNPINGKVDSAAAPEDRPADAQAAGELHERVASLEARIGRLDVLSERVADLARVEIDALPATAKLPAIGGPSNAEIAPPQTLDIYAAIDQLAQQIDAREQQFDNLQAIFANRNVGESALFDAQPVLHPEISSYFGMRIDPVTGARNMHDGIDFTGKTGTAIMAVADGVVTYAADKQGYGRLIEINHGDDCYTRYAHSRLVFVKAGDVVKKGQVIALMGSSGRATGTHLHFEVYKHGRPVDPYIYIRQASR
jgi:murein DD-endopeptidase MepM/ murein hydrolase activator NlpD